MNTSSLNHNISKLIPQYEEKNQQEEDVSPNRKNAFKRFMRMQTKNMTKKKIQPHNSSGMQIWTVDFDLSK